MKGRVCSLGLRVQEFRVWRLRLGISYGAANRKIEN